MSKKKALVTGLTGQDGSYLADLLLEKGYEVHGIVRRVALEDPARHLHRVRHLVDDIHLHPASLESYPSIFRVMGKVLPDEVYHLAAQSYVAYSFEDEFSTINTNINGTLNVLSSVQERVPSARLYFAGSSEMFGKVRETPQTEETPFHPRSPYGVSKVTGFDMTRNYREANGMFACSGILFNHESPRRGFEFVTRKITSVGAQIKVGQAKELRLGNLDASRDWGFAGDYVKAMWLMLQQDAPDDYVVATGRSHTVREFVKMVFDCLGLRWEDHVVVDKELYRPAEVNLLRGDYSKAARELGWKPDVGIERLVEMMVEADLKLLEK